MRLEKLVREIFNNRTLPGRVLFRVDAANRPGLSFGHLSRCLTIASQLKKTANSKVRFLMRNYQEGIKFAKKFRVNIEVVDAKSSKKDYLRKFESELLNFRPQYLVADLPKEDPNPLFDLARKNRIKSICLDDMGRQPFRSDTIVNGNILAKRIKYKNSNPAPRFLLGDRYFIMRDYSDVKLSKKNFFIVLITFGGSDIMGLTKKALAIIGKIPPSSVIYKVILGPGIKDKQLILCLAKKIKNLSVFDYPKDVRKFMLECGLAICSGGTTLQELVTLNKPCIAIASSKFEAMVIKEFTRRRLIYFGLEEWNSRKFLREMSSAIFTLSK